MGLKLTRSPEISLEEVECEQSRMQVKLTFPENMEKLYRDHSVNERRNLVIINWVVCCLLFDLFLLSDYLVAGDDFMSYEFGRVCILSPICALTLIFLYNHNKYFDVIICLLQILYAVVLTVLLIHGHGTYREAYLFGNILVIICGYVISRQPIYHAIITAGLQCVAFVITVLFSDIMGADGKVVSILFCVCGALVTIMAAYALEKTARRAFLLGFRVQLLNDQLKTMAMSDSLTGLGNRRLFEKSTTDFWADAALEPAQASFILIDIDHFKAFNDSQGHSAGDLCLSTIAQRIYGAIRQTDIAVRFGGEEIIVFLPNTAFCEALALAALIKGAITSEAIPHPALGPNALVTASLGVATEFTKDCTPGDLVIRADTALYAAKHHGRNQIWPPIEKHHSPTIEPQLQMCV